MLPSTLVARFSKSLLASFQTKLDAHMSLRKPVSWELYFALGNVSRNRVNFPLVYTALDVHDFLGICIVFCLLVTDSLFRLSQIVWFIQIVFGLQMCC